MSHEALRWLHVLTFALWFGTDLGVFKASLAVTDSRLPVETRRFALRLLMALDLVPRFAMLGVVALAPWLAQPFLGFSLPAGWMALWSLGILAWGGLVFRLHHGGWAQAAAWRRFDVFLRLSLMLGCGVAASHPQVYGLGAWLSLKLLLLALAVGCGLAVRLLLVPFGADFGRLVAEGSTPSLEAALRRSLGRTRYCVLGIYGCVLLAAWLGIAKPAWP